MRQFIFAIAISGLSISAVTPAVAVSNIGPWREDGAKIDCSGPLRGGYTKTLSRQLEPKGMKAIKKQAPAEWSKQVAQACPKADPSWSRARGKTLSCGHFSSSLRYTCNVTATPRRKR